MRKSKQTLLLLLMCTATYLPFAWAQCDDNQCLYFDGAGDQITLSTIPIAGNSSFTIEAWFNADAGTGNCSADFKRLFALSGPGSRFELGVCGGGQLHFYWFNGQPPFLSGPVTIPTGSVLNAWRHVAVTRSGSVVQIFLDCELVYTGTMNVFAFNFSTFRVGYWLGPPQPNGYWQGRIDDIRIWNIIRSEKEICDNKYCVLPGTTGLAVHWTLDQGAIPGGDNTSVTQAIDITGNGFHGSITAPPANNFSLNGPVSNFVLSNIFDLNISDLPTQSTALTEICSGEAVHFCITEGGGSEIASQPGLSVVWECDDGSGWQPVADPVFSGFCFAVPPGRITVPDCISGPGYIDKRYRAIITQTIGAETCTFCTNEYTLRVCCPVSAPVVNINVSPAGILNGTLCEGDVVSLDVSLSGLPPFAGAMGNAVQISWTINGAMLPAYDNQTSFSYPVTAGTEDYCFEAIVSNCGCPAQSVQECIAVDPIPHCGSIQGVISSGLLPDPDNNPDHYIICPGDDATLVMINPSDFENCTPVWQYLFPSEGIWRDLGAGNSTQNTNILPTYDPSLSPYLWPAGETCIFYRIECRPFSDPSGCEPCHSNLIRICLQLSTPADDISGSGLVCQGGVSMLSVDNYDPALQYTWYCDGLSVGTGPTYNAAQQACYWAVISNGCAGQHYTTAPICLTVCEIEPVISCPLMPNECACEGEPITLSGCSSMDNCSGLLEFLWTDSFGNVLGTDCILTHTPDPGGTTYTLIVTNLSTGCTVEASTTIVPCAEE